MRSAPIRSHYRKPADYSHACVAHAVAVGALVPAEKCEACNRTAVDIPKARRHSTAFVWHHWSVRPEHALDVTPLCRSCHGKVHAGSIPEPRTGAVYCDPDDWLRSVKRVSKPRVWQMPSLANLSSDP